jgi:hypothetical protein
MTPKNINLRLKEKHIITKKFTIDNRLRGMVTIVIYCRTVEDILLL